jgi:Asp/Glu/hydantoin racemase
MTTMGGPRILLINPNSAVATTEMMVALARDAAGARATITGATAQRAPAMIIDPAALTDSETEVVEIARAHEGMCDGVIVSAFGDPGLAAIRAQSTLPVVGIAESAILTAAEGGRRFGIVTTTPTLGPAIAGRVAALGVTAQYTGIRFTAGDAAVLVASPPRLQAALTAAIERSIATDGAEAVIIGGGPLGGAAASLQGRFAVPIIAPIPAATYRLLNLLSGAAGAG